MHKHMGMAAAIVAGTLSASSAWAQFVVTGQTGTSTLGARSQSIADGTLTSAQSYVGAEGLVSSVQGMSMSTQTDSVLGANSLQISGNYFVMSEMRRTWPAGYPTLPVVDPAATEASVRFSLAQSTTVTLSAWDWVNSNDAASHVGLLQVQADGSLVSVSLPVLNYVGFGSGGFSGWSPYQGTTTTTLSAGDYVLKMAFSLTPPLGAIGPAGGSTAGVRLTAAVPEPGTWLTMGVGLLALGAVARRQRPI